MSNDTYVTVMGNLVENPRQLVTSGGVHLVTMRVASTSRRFDRETGRWRDGDTLYINVSCWRWLADNVAASLQRGQPVVVHGRLRMRSYTNSEGKRRTSVEIDASTIGHDLSRGISRFQKARRGVPAGETNATGQDGAAQDGAAQDWAGQDGAAQVEVAADAATVTASPLSTPSTEVSRLRAVTDPVEEDATGAMSSSTGADAWLETADDQQSAA